MSQKKIAGFELIKKLGKGSFSEVFLVYGDRKKSEKLALKRFLDAGNKLTIEREISALELMSEHPHTPNLRDVVRLGNEVLLLMDHIEGPNVYQMVRRNGTFSEEQARRFLADTLSQLAFMHARGVLHTDIKMTNVMEHKGRHCLIDFGLSQPSTCIKTITLTGGERYMAPEIFQGVRNQASDMYALGSVFHYGLTGKFPFGLVKEDPLEKKIFACMHWDLDLDFPASKQTKYILSRMMEKDPMQRATVEEIESLMRGDLKIPEDPLPTRDKRPLPEGTAATYELLARENRRNVYAQYRYALLLEKGEAVDQDETQAIEWFLHSASRGYALAQHRLGFLYYAGRCGLKRDYGQALYWFSKSFDQGFHRSQYYLGRMHELGRGVNKNASRAISFYSLAAENGDVTARERLEEMAKS